MKQAEASKSGSERMTSVVRVLLVDDNASFRQLLRRLLERDPEILIVGEASNGGEALDRVEADAPDVVLMDVSMPRLGGVEATRAVRSQFPEVEVLILTMHADASVVADAVRAGAAGYLVKDCSADDIVGMLEAVAKGESSLSPDLASSFLAEAQRAETTSAAQEPSLLTGREEEVLIPVAQGRTNSEIADDLHISLSTVKTHLASLMRKLGARNRVEIAMWAYETGRIGA